MRLIGFQNWLVIETWKNGVRYKHQKSQKCHEQSLMECLVGVWESQVLVGLKKGQNYLVIHQKGARTLLGTELDTIYITFYQWFWLFLPGSWVLKWGCIQKSWTNLFHKVKFEHISSMQAVACIMLNSLSEKKKKKTGKHIKNAQFSKERPMCKFKVTNWVVVQKGAIVCKEVSVL